MYKIMEYNTLIWDHDEKNPWYEALKSYKKCYNRYFFVFNSLSDWEEELKRPDINTVCKKELNGVISAASSLGYREVAGIVSEYWDIVNDEPI